MAEAKFKLDAALAARRTDGEKVDRVVAIVLTWNQWIDAWEQATESLDRSPDSITADFAQFRALCLSLGGLFIAPLGQSSSGAAWREREDSYRVIVDQVTRELMDRNRSQSPIGDELNFLARRYFDSGYVDEDGRADGAAAVGIQPQFAGEGATPIWLRFHKATPKFAAIRDRVAASTFRHAVRRDDRHRHVWLPLDVQPDLSELDLVVSLASQVRAIQESLSP